MRAEQARGPQPHEIVGQSLDPRDVFLRDLDLPDRRERESTSNGILLLFVFFEKGQVVRVRPEDLPLTDVVRTR